MIKNILSLSQKLIAIPSTQENSKALTQVINLAATELRGLKSTRFTQNEKPSLLVFNQPASRYKIILNAHLDVVPAKASQFKPTINGNRIYGRGANDMKAAAAVEILLFKNLAKSLPYPIALQLVTDEEIGGFAGTKHQIQKGVKADFVIAGEPTNLGINSQAKGIINLEISARGKTAHGAYPWQGQNALTAVTNAVYTITKAHPTPKKEVWQTTYNLSWIKTDNITTNKVPDTATASFDIRYTPQDTGKIIPQLKTLLKNHPVKLSFLLHEPAQFTDVKNSFLVKLRQSVKNTTGKLAPIIVKHGGSDIRHFTTKNMAGVTFGPKGAGLHTDNEWVDINSLVQYYAILENFIKTL